MRISRGCGPEKSLRMSVGFELRPRPDGKHFIVLMAAAGPEPREGAESREVVTNFFDEGGQRRQRKANDRPFHLELPRSEQPDMGQK